MQYVQNVIRPKNTPLFLIFISICFSFYYIDLGFAFKPFMIFSLLFFLLSLNKFVIHKPMIYEKMLLFYFLYYCTTGLFAKYPAASLRLILGVCLVVFCYFVIKYIMSLASLENIEKTILVTGIIFNSLSLILYVAGILKLGFIGGNQIKELGVMMDRGFPRLIGLTADPNIFCFYNFVFFFFYLTHLNKKWAKTGFFLSSATMLLSLSRGGLISIAFGLGLMFFTSSLSKKIKMVFVFPISCYLINLLIKTTINIDVFKMVTDRFLANDGGSGRLSIWEKGLELFQQHPIFGVGIGNYRPHVIAEYGNAIYMHNTYLETLVESGVIGITIYALIFLFVFFTYFKNRHQLNDNGYLIYTFTAVTFMMATYSFMVNEIFFLTLALIWRYLYEIQRKQLI